MEKSSPVFSQRRGDYGFDAPYVPAIFLLIVLIIADIGETHRYAEHLRDLGMTTVTHQMLDWRFWYGAPWVMTKLVKATKPS